MAGHEAAFAVSVVNVVNFYKIRRLLPCSTQVTSNAVIQTGLYNTGMQQKIPLLHLGQFVRYK